MMKYRTLQNKGRIIINSDSKILYHIVEGNSLSFRNYFYLAIKRNVRCFKIKQIKRQDLHKIVAMLNFENKNGKNGVI